MSDAVLANAQRRIGTTIKGKYRVEGVLGTGGMAVVYAVTHTRNNASLALKMLHPELSYREDIRTRFLREGYAANTVAHPGVVMVVDDDVTEDGAVFIVMERLQGCSVEQLGKEIPVRDAAAIVDQLLDVLGAAHRKGIVHRDVKPANLFLTRDGTVKVLDFGIAKVRDALASVTGQTTSSGVLMGTPAFMSPEQALAKTPEIDARSDIWAAGATLFNLASGRFVHEADNAPQMLVKAATQAAPSLASVAPSAPEPIVEVVARALAQDPSARFQTADEMRGALRDAHKKAFGDLPSRESLAAIVTAIEVTRSVDVIATAPTEKQRPMEVTPPARPIESTTAEPVSAVQPTAPPARPRVAYAGGAVAAIVLASGIAWITLHRPPATSSAAEPSAPPPTISATAPPATTPTAVVSASAAPPVSTAPVSSAPPAASSVARSTPKPVKPAAAASASAKPSCDPPYTTDERGHHVYKPECM